MSKGELELPSSVWSVLGPVPVMVVAELKAEDGEICLGLWKPLAREIHIREGMHPATALVTAVHEWVHLLLWDFGVHLTNEQEESVCDAVAAGIVADLLAHRTTNK